MKIAVVGAGVSGLTAAHHLQREHEVVLFEAERRPGGHTHTVDVSEGGRAIPIDTGFIVFNTRTYPGFVALLAELGVPSAPSNMSFSVRSERRDFEYGSDGLGGLFAQRRRLASPRHWRMLRDLVRFYREGRELLTAGPEMPIGMWLRMRGYSDGFSEDHLMPMIRALWSADRRIAEDFPARFLARFLDNHGFMQLRATPWLTIPGGSRTYVEALLARFGGGLRLGAPVRSVRRVGEGAAVVSDGGSAEAFDHVVLACHADQALALLADPSDLERELLGAFAYQPNEVVLHTDERLMPRSRRAWAAWNVHLDDAGEAGASVTYWMNRLQPLAAERDYFVTLNQTARIRPDRILRVDTFAHPVFGVRSVAAQGRHAELLEAAGRATSFCGAYWGNGFHEDGVQSARRVVASLAGARGERQVAA